MNAITDLKSTTLIFKYYVINYTIRYNASSYIFDQCPYYNITIHGLLVVFILVKYELYVHTTYNIKTGKQFFIVFNAHAQLSLCVNTVVYFYYPKFTNELLRLVGTLVK